ncbi:MAG TPA: family 16 glycoside hydrolase, partial [Gemmataceae bacterium]|nr:family 16 glycoside hydrolase [Gemmataceae bacterium]
APTRAFPAPDSDPGDGPTHTSGEPSTEGEDDLGFLSPPQRADSLGRIGQYEVLEVLGRGGFGTVYRAFDEVLQRVVAVKVLAPAMAATSPARKRFLREARSAAQVRHENVVQVHAVEEQPLPYLVMEYVPGGTLQQRLDQTGPLDLSDVLRIGRQIAEGLAAAHAQDLIHRDVKPGNILIEAGPQQRVKLTDFGLARAADDASISQSGVVAGTPMYMAPEQAKGEALDHRADLFSLGSVLYVMASGRPPFRAAGTLAVLKRVAEDAPRPIREIIPEVPEWLCRIIAKLHTKNPADRFQTAAEVAALLADCEQQVQTHGAVRDFSRIPGGRPRATVQRALVGAGLVAAALLVACVLLFNFSLYRYATNRGDIEFNGGADPDVEKLLVWRDGELVTTLDWTNRRVALAPGEYELEAVCLDGYDATKFNVETTRFLTYTYTFERADDRPAVKFTVRRGDASTVGVTSERRPERPSTTAGEWVQLFNGKDLTGWKKHPRLPGFWHVGDGMLIATGPVKESYLATEQGDFENFHLHMELQVDDPLSDSGVFLRVPFPEFKDFAEVNISFDPKRPLEQAGSIIIQRAGGTQVRSAKGGLAAAGRWFTLDIIVQGDEVTTLVNGKPGVTTTLPPGHRRGHLLLQQAGDKAAVRFRKIEVKDLPASPAAVPRTAAEVLPYLVGTWKTELVVVEPKLPPEAAREVGEQTYEYVAGDKFLRSRGMIGGRESVAVCGFDPATNQFSSWFTMDKGLPSGPAAGVFNAGDRTMEWLERLPNGNTTFVENKYVDANTITTRHYQQDPANKFVRKLEMTGTRAARPTTPAYRPADPNRPAEMKVLDRYVGEWHNEQTVTDAATPDQPKRETVRVRAGLILGGRCVEEVVTNDTTGGSNYTLAWFDPAAKLYRRWFFSGAGPVTELTGTWDEAAKTLTWNSTDKAVVVREVFTSDDRSEFRLTFKNRAGKTVTETAGVARRVNAGWVPLFNGQDLTGWKTHPDAPGNWTVAEGILKGSGRAGTLFTDRGDYANFRLRAEVRVNTPADARIQFRAPHALAIVDADEKRFAVPDCYLVHYRRVGPFPFKPTATLARADKYPVPTDLHDPRAGLVGPNEWFTLHLTAAGGRIVAAIDGKEVADYTDPRQTYTKGHVALTTFTDDTVIEVRKIEIQELTPTGAGGGKTDKP